MKAPTHAPIPVRKFKWTIYWPLPVIAVLCLFCWMVQRQHRTAAKNAALEAMLANFTYSAEDQAAQAFSVGEFRQAEALLAAAGAVPSASPSTQLMRARTLECLGRFAEAAKIYSSLEDVPSMSLAVLQGKKFSQRMAGERIPVVAHSRESIYRLHAELMQRGDAATAHLIARQLLPDTEPTRCSAVALLQQLDQDAEITASNVSGRLDVTICHLDPKILALLRDLKIGTLTVSRAGLDAPHILAVLDVLALDLSYNGFSDLAGVRALPLRRLDLNDTRTADLRPLAGMPLRELNLSRTMATNLTPLCMCPLEKLNLCETSVRDLEPLRGLALRDLDLSHTRVSDLSPLSGMPLERLILTGTAIRSLKPLAGAHLKSLIIVGTAIKDLADLAGMPLVELDLRGCEMLSDLDALATCPRLERVYLPRHVRIPEGRWGLPNLTVIRAESAAKIARK